MHDKMPDKKHKNCLNDHAEDLKESVKKKELENDVRVRERKGQEFVNSCAYTHERSERSKKEKTINQKMKERSKSNNKNK